MKKYNNFKTIGYHVSLASNDNEILENGIISIPHEIYRYGKKEISTIKNYFWLDLKYAEWFKSFKENDNNDMSIWVVELDGYKLNIDEEALDMSEWSNQFEKNENGHAVYITENIPPSKIKYKL
jgi:hypothetical protein